MQYWVVPSLLVKWYKEIIQNIKMFKCCIWLEADDDIIPSLISVGIGL